MILDYFIVFNSQKVQKNINFDPFSPYLQPCRPLIGCKIWVILFYLFRLYNIDLIFIINHWQWTILLDLIAKKFKKTSILTHFCTFLPYLRPFWPLIGCKIWVILFYLFRLHNIVLIPIINYWYWTILLHLIGKKFRKTSILSHFRPFLPYLQPCRPLIGCKI